MHIRCSRGFQERQDLSCFSLFFEDQKRKKHIPGGKSCMRGDGKEEFLVFGPALIINIVLTYCQTLS